MSEKAKRYLMHNTPGIVIEQIDGNAPTYSLLTDTDVGGFAYKLHIGEECNRLLDHADVLESFERVLLREQTIRDIRSIVARVAEFEDLEEEP